MSIIKWLWFIHHSVEHCQADIKIFQNWGSNYHYDFFSMSITFVFLEKAPEDIMVFS